MKQSTSDFTNKPWEYTLPKGKPPHKGLCLIITLLILAMAISFASLFF